MRALAVPLLAFTALIALDLWTTGTAESSWLMISGALIVVWLFVACHRFALWDTQGVGPPLDTGAAKFAVQWIIVGVVIALADMVFGLLAALINAQIGNQVLRSLVSVAASVAALICVAHRLPSAFIVLPAFAARHPLSWEKAREISAPWRRDVTFVVVAPFAAHTLIEMVIGFALGKQTIGAAAVIGLLIYLAIAIAAIVLTTVPLSLLYADLLVRAGQQVQETDETT